MVCLAPTWKISCAWRMALPAPRPGGTGGTGLAYIFTIMGEFKVYGLPTDRITVQSPYVSTLHLGV